MSFHEWGGIIFFCLFILHLILNWKWIRSVTAKLFKKTTGIKLKVSWVVNFLLFISVYCIIKIPTIAEGNPQSCMRIFPIIADVFGISLRPQ